MKILSSIFYLNLYNNYNNEKNFINVSQTKDIDYSKEVNKLNNSNNFFTRNDLNTENQKLQKLKEIDNKVKAHEEAHYITGSPYTSYPKYNYIKGPDGGYYAISGEVNIDTSPENNPKKTIKKMEKVIKAALAPSDPSSKDLQVAMKAKRELEKAKLELEKQKYSENSYKV